MRAGKPRVGCQSGAVAGGRAVEYRVALGTDKKGLVMYLVTRLELLALVLNTPAQGWRVDGWSGK